jgi:hypothetical protein
MEPLKEDWRALLVNTTVGDLLREDIPDFLRSISVR